MSGIQGLRGNGNQFRLTWESRQYRKAIHIIYWARHTNEDIMGFQKGGEELPMMPDTESELIPAKENVPVRGKQPTPLMRGCRIQYSLENARLIQLIWLTAERNKREMRNINALPAFKFQGWAVYGTAHSHMRHWWSSSCWKPWLQHQLIVCGPYLFGHAKDVVKVLKPSSSWA